MTDPRLALNAFWYAAGLAEWARYRRALADPAASQARLLRQYVRRGQDTAFGRRHGFARISSVGDYRARVPLTTYDDYAADIARIGRGDAAVLTRARVRRFMPSSGSTAAAKLIPYTGALQREFSRAICAWIVDLFGRDRRLLDGAAYWSVSPGLHVVDREPGIIPVGFEEDSAYLGGIWQRVVSRVLVAPAAVRLITDPDSFRYVTLLLLVRERNLRLISVWHPSFLTLVLRALPLYWEAIRRDIAAGTVRPPRPLPAAAETGLRRRLRADPGRAAELGGVGPENPAGIWPRLRLVSCWAHGPARLHLDGLRSAFPEVRIQPKGLIATEAFVTVPFEEAWPLAVRSHFFEFAESDGRVRLAHELDSGGVYRVVVTTGGGLYRYCLGDRVRVIGRIARTPSLEFLGKEDGVADRFGEKLSEGFVMSVLNRLLSPVTRPRFALLSPEQTGAGTAYTLFVEYEGSAPPDLAASLERGLRANPHYAYCVDLGQLLPARVVRIAGGAYEAYARRIGGRRRLGDIKPGVLDPAGGWTDAFTAPASSSASAEVTAW